ncbi:transporter [Agrilutibacter solisilvae]|uniref:Transporter n=1 Tax=Agrilutibacter solisilvae TaxID=2763317 RepID=A0A974XWQ8_9GAMM|nr:transporter [Lysobacter solisilvae]QSX77277.1 transporter [Lysobacter solisilvae]
MLALAVPVAHAQDIEPRAYSNAPVGVNFVIAGAVFTRGGLSFDTSVPITGAQLESSTLVLAYARTLDLWGKSGKLDVIVPYTRLVGTADYLGQPVERDVTGFGRPALRMSINLLGAPALGLREFGQWKQDVIVGASLQVSPPWGQYDSSRIVNIGSNRWSFKPEVGISKAAGPWTLELQAAATFFTDNDEFYGGNTRSQDPVYSLQGHVIYGFASGKWVSVDATYFTGGRTRINGVRGDDLQQNWRVGAILAIPVDRHNSIKLSASSGVSARTGNNFDAIGVAWQHRWGGGL